MLDLLYDQETAIERKMKAVHRDGVAKGKAEGIEELIEKMKLCGMSQEDIVKIINTQVPKVQ